MKDKQAAFANELDEIAGEDNRAHDSAILKALGHLDDEVDHENELHHKSSSK